MVRELLIGLTSLPLPLVILGVLGLAIYRRRTASLLVLMVSIGGLLGLCLPVVGGGLSRMLVSTVAPYESGTPADAILVPTAGVFRDSTGVWWPSSTSILRATAGQNLHVETGLPMAIIGGAPIGTEPPEADVVVEKLSLKAPPLLLETAARNSRETAAAAKNLFQNQSVGVIILVTSSHHVARMAASLRREGFVVLGFVTEPTERPKPGWTKWVPSGDGFLASRAALHEITGLLWYWANGYIRLSDIIHGS